VAGTGDGREGRGKRSRREHLRLAALFHPRRQAILWLLLDGREAEAGEIAAALGADRGRIGYHLRVLVKRGVLQGVARGASPALYRWSPGASWARKMLKKSEEQDAE
jgi:DNA-binding transcriptional ArsR family regulator